MYSAMADLAGEYGDEGLLQACKTLWDNIVTKRMYITGSIGSSGLLERFTTDYDLPNDCNYSESCASIGLAMFGMRMARITEDASYVDVVERALYNTVLSGIALDGRSFFYVNPLEVWPDTCLKRTSREHVKPIRQKWYGVACCPPNIARTLASLGQYIYAGSEDTLYVNLFVSGSMETSLLGRTVQVRMQTRFPYENEYELSVSGVPAEGIRLALRVPDYSRGYRITVNGEPRAVQTDKGYAYLTLTCDSRVKGAFEAPAELIRANPNVHADCGRVALRKGPLVYCLEEIDNGKNLSALYVDAGTEIREEKSGLFGGCTVLKFQGKRMKDSEWGTDELYGTHTVCLAEVALQAIPYAYWNNRGMGEMTVWLKELL